MADRDDDRGPAPLTRRQRVRRIANMVNLSTPTGLAITRFAGCPSAPGPRGLILAWDYRWPTPKAHAFTVGNVVLTRAPAPLIDGPLLVHEEHHASQWAWCLGMFGFPILYAAASGWSELRAGDYSSRNLFERRAGLAEGGYRERPSRPIPTLQTRRWIRDRRDRHGPPTPTFKP